MKNTKSYLFQKRMLISGISLFFAAAFLLLINLDSETGSLLKDGRFYVALIILALALLMLAIGRYRHNRLFKILDEKYIDAYERLNMKISNSRINMTGKRMARDILLEIMADSKESGRPIDELLKNEDEFVDELVESAGGIRLSRKWYILGTQFYIGYLLAMKGYMFVKNGDFTFNGYLSTELDYIIIIMFGLISFVFIPIVRNLLYKQFEGKSIKTEMTLVIVLLILIVAMFMFAPVWFDATFLLNSVAVINTWYYLVLAITIVIVAEVLKTKLGKKA